MTRLQPPALRGAPEGRWRIAPSDVRYIKLGPGGAWVDDCLQSRTLEIGHNTVPSDLTAAGDWTAVRQVFLDAGASASKASDFTRELRDFHTLDETVLWVTTARGRLWWTFANPSVEPAGAPGRGSRQRRTVGGWRCTDVEGAALTLDSLSTRLTKVAAYRQTLCRVEAADYLIRRINAQPEAQVAQALVAKAALAEATQAMIEQLHWRDFELLADLIFSHGGWRRVSAVGGSDQVDSDLVLEQATTGERAMVQVKSAADQAVLADYVRRFDDGGWDRGFFLCHSPSGALASPANPRFHLWQGPQLADQALKAGLLDWLIARSR